MKTLISALVLTLAAASAAGAQTIAGDWQGTLAAGPVELRLVVHLTADERGGFTASLDSPDQGVKGMTVTGVSLTNSVLTFQVPQIGGSYEGRVDANASAISGAWSQVGMSLPLNLARVPAASTVTRVPKPSEVDGDWEGSLNAGPVVLRMVLHIATFEDGMSATLDVPDQNASGIPASTIARDGTTLRFEIKALAATYTGTLDAGLSTIDGTWTQVGNALPLVLKRRR